MKLTTLATVSSLTTLGLANPVLHWRRQVNSTTLSNGTATEIITPLTTGIITTGETPTEVADETTVLPETGADSITDLVVKLLDLEALLQLSLGQTLALSLGAYVGRFNAMVSAGMGTMGENAAVEGEEEPVVEIDGGVVAEPIAETENEAAAPVFEVPVGDVADAEPEVVVEEAEPVVESDEGVQVEPEAMMVAA
ncbi:hypothetical protein QBC40DRAFT_266123 [Triangularia verruculosa]|uniref:Uncharacterized protein n=1 Tax=Triangularia verruculosa TaxID=2587418 RepID=A0AAN6XGL8_9PEZI|nr:hypothetical protein QBC40DRAFT_266123 [Triangularia verruculosa]